MHLIKTYASITSLLYKLKSKSNVVYINSNVYTFHGKQYVLVAMRVVYENQSLNFWWRAATEFDCLINHFWI